MDFKDIVDRFIAKRGIGAVVQDIKIEGNKCNISLRGGFSNSLELIDNILYKDNVYYCKVEELFEKSDWYKKNFGNAI